jgi:hypothetical protein
VPDSSRLLCTPVNAAEPVRREYCETDYGVKYQSSRHVTRILNSRPLSNNNLHRNRRWICDIKYRYFDRALTLQWTGTFIILLKYLTHYSAHVIWLTVEHLHANILSHTLHVNQLDIGTHMRELEKWNQRKTEKIILQEFNNSHLKVFGF